MQILYITLVFPEVFHTFPEVFAEVCNIYLLRSLQTASYDGDAVKLVIRVDHARDNAKVIELSTSFQFSHGEKHVVVSGKKLGLRKQWLDAWSPGEDDEKGIIIEDDVEVACKRNKRDTQRKHDHALRAWVGRTPLLYLYF